MPDMDAFDQDGGFWILGYGYVSFPSCTAMR